MTDQAKRNPGAAKRGSGRGGAFFYAVVATVAAGGAIAGAMLLSNIAQRKAEAEQVAFALVPLEETTVDPAEWGKNFPRQYDGYKRTADNERTRFGGSESLPLADDPLGKAVQKLEVDPRLRVIFNGYAFALDYRERRGHAFMLHDQRETDRVKLKPQPGACLNCHASNVLAFRQAGLGAGAPGHLSEPLTSENGMAQLFKGFDKVNKMTYADASELVNHPVTCLDCHDPKTLALRITKPGFINGIRALAKSDDPVPHLPSVEQWRKGSRAREYDPNDLASRQEMRSMTCAQCHVEYYFKGEGKTLTFPWHKGLKLEQIEAYYNETGWTDFKHKDSGAPVLKAQHPEFEMWSQGIHARSGVSCADCHMPYKREGAIKVSDHQVRSPMLNTARACQTCHNYSENEIKERVAAIQDRTHKLMGRAEDAVVELISAIKSAAESGASDEQLKPARTLQRQAQFRCDFVNAENSMGFHAPAEAARILGEAIDYARQGVAEVMKVTGGKGYKSLLADKPATPGGEPGKAAEKVEKPKEGAAAVSAAGGRPPG